LNNGRPREALVACLGSSSTQGKGQAYDWIAELRSRPANAGARFLDLGAGGDLAYNTLQRVSRAIRLQPDHVVIQVGGDDVLASVFPNVKRILRFWKRLPQDPSLSWYEENLRKIVRRLSADTSARIALCSLNPIGESPGSSDPVQRILNRLIEDYSGIIKLVAEQESGAPDHERSVGLIIT
jgi:lysophospholipase L1-like esterase